MFKKPIIQLSKSLVIIIAVILSIIVVALVVWQLFKYDVIKGKVKSVVYEKTNGLYTIHYDKMDLDEVGGFLHVTNLSIIPDTAKFRQLIAGKENPAVLLSLTVPELVVAGVKTPKAMLNKKISGRKIEIKNASVVLYYSKANHDTASPPPTEMYQQLLGDLKEIQVDSLEVSHVSFAFINILNDKTTIAAEDISVHLRDVQIDSLHNHDTSRLFFTKHVLINGAQASIKNKPSTYVYRFNQFSFNSDERSLSAASIQIEPQLSEEEFAAYSKLQKDRFNLNFNQVALQGIDIASLMNGNILSEQLAIKSLTCKVFRDLSYPRDKIIRIGQFPQQMLMKVPFLLSVKKTTVGNAFIEYKERNPKSGYSGRLQFMHANAVIKNLTNDLAAIKRNNHCTVDFNASFLDLAPVNVHLDLLLADANGRFNFSGGLKDGFDAVKLNELIEPMGMARIEKGHVNGLDFSFSAHNRGSEGRVTLLYNDLKLTLLKKDSTDEEFKKKKLASFIANVIIKNDNPQKKKPVRIETVHYDRNTNRSFFNLLWKSVYTGIKQTAGM
ncbi:MAG: hypothetical protein QM726_22720 [Chitinophagaceae bacterium]